MNDKQIRNMQVLIAALLSERENKEYILTKEKRTELMSYISFRVCSELDEDLNEKFYLVSNITGERIK